MSIVGNYSAGAAQANITRQFSQIINHIDEITNSAQATATYQTQVVENYFNALDAALGDARFDGNGRLVGGTLYEQMKTHLAEQLGLNVNDIDDWMLVVGEDGEILGMAIEGFFGGESGIILIEDTQGFIDQELFAQLGGITLEDLGTRALSGTVYPETSLYGQLENAQSLSGGDSQIVDLETRIAGLETAIQTDSLKTFSDLAGFLDMDFEFDLDVETALRPISVHSATDYTDYLGPGSDAVFDDNGRLIGGTLYDSMMSNISQATGIPTIDIQDWMVVLSDDGTEVLGIAVNTWEGNGWTLLSNDQGMIPPELVLGQNGSPGIGGINVSELRTRLIGDGTNTGGLLYELESYMNQLGDLKADLVLDQMFAFGAEREMLLRIPEGERTAEQNQRIAYLTEQLEVLADEYLELTDPNGDYQTHSHNYAGTYSGDVDYLEHEAYSNADDRAMAILYGERGRNYGGSVDPDNMFAHFDVDNPDHNNDLTGFAQFDVTQHRYFDRVVALEGSAAFSETFPHVEFEQEVAGSIAATERAIELFQDPDFTIESFEDISSVFDVSGGEGTFSPLVKELSIDFEIFREIMPGTGYTREIQIPNHEDSDVEMAMLWRLSRGHHVDYIAKALGHGSDLSSGTLVDRNKNGEVDGEDFLGVINELLEHGLLEMSALGKILGEELANLVVGNAGERALLYYDRSPHSASAAYEGNGNLGWIELKAAGLTDLEASRILRHGTGNGDGFLTAAEINELVDRGVLSVDGYGNISITEDGRKMISDFQKMDANSNGIITREEYIAALTDPRSEFYMEGLTEEQAGYMYDNLFGSTGSDGVTFEEAFLTGPTEGGSAQYYDYLMEIGLFPRDGGSPTQDTVNDLVGLGVLEPVNDEAADFFVEGQGYRFSDSGRDMLDEFIAMDKNGDGLVIKEEYVQYRIENGGHSEDSALYEQAYEENFGENLSVGYTETGVIEGVSLTGYLEHNLKEGAGRRAIDHFDTKRGSRNDDELNGHELENAGLDTDTIRVLTRGTGDRNGKLSEQEIQNLVDRGIIRVDANGNIALTELGELYMAEIGKIDLNGNGVISRSEYISALTDPDSEFYDPNITRKQAGYMYDNLFGPTAQDGVTFEELYLSDVAAPTAELPVTYYVPLAAFGVFPASGNPPSVEQVEQLVDLNIVEAVDDKDAEFFVDGQGYRLTDDAKDKINAFYQMDFMGESFQEVENLFRELFGLEPSEENYLKRYYGDANGELDHAEIEKLIALGILEEGSTPDDIRLTDFGRETIRDFIITDRKESTDGIATKSEAETTFRDLGIYDEFLFEEVFFGGSEILGDGLILDDDADGRVTLDEWLDFATDNRPSA